MDGKRRVRGTWDDRVGLGLVVGDLLINCKN